MSNNEIAKYIVSAIVCIVIVGAAFSFGRQTVSTDGRTGSNTAGEAELNATIRAEQLATRDGIERAIESITAIRGISETTDSALRELRMADRRSSDIYQEIREEIAILDDYFRNISNVVADYYNSNGSK